MVMRVPPRYSDFYPRPPRGGRPPAFCGLGSALVFLSTPSARRATLRVMSSLGTWLFLSTPSARRATKPPTGFVTTETYFYPRPPRGGRRSIRSMCCSPGAYFYPRPPRGGRRVFTSHARRGTGISIHALREEGDYSADPSSTDSSNFYPRPPRGGRRTTPETLSIRSRFLSTPSARRATQWP